MEYQDIEKAERVLTQLTDTFRAVQYLDEVVATLKPLVGQLTQIKEQLATKLTALDAAKGELEQTKIQLADTQAEKVKLDKMLGSIKAQLKDFGLFKG